MIKLLFIFIFRNEDNNRFYTTFLSIIMKQSNENELKTNAK